MKDKFWMQQAYEQALLAEKEGEVPVGAVLVSAEGELLAAGRNRLQKSCNPCDHAELSVIRDASQFLHTPRLLNTTLYVTLEPCSMCAGAMVLARIKRLVFATRDFKSGAAGSVLNILGGYPLNHQVMIDEGVLQEPCALLLSEFFKKRRLGI